MKIKNLLMSMLLLASSRTPGVAADPFTVSYPANLQVLSPNAGPGPAGPSGPGPYHMANMSGAAQRRWTRVAVPTAIADTLPQVLNFNQTGVGTIQAYKGRKLGDMVTMVHVLGDINGNETRDGALQAGGTSPAPFQFSEWITDDPSKMVMTLRAVRNGVPTSLPFQFRETLESNPIARTDRYMTNVTGGVWGEVFLTFYTNQDVVDMEGHFGWCDQSDPNWFTNFDSIELTMGEDMELYFANRSGFQPIQNGWQLFSNAQLSNGKFPHGMAPHFYGVILPKSNTAQTANPPNREARLAWLEAARQGPVLMTGGELIWEGNWFAFGEVPKVPANLDGVSLANASAAAFRSYLNDVGGFWDVRPLGNNFSIGATGDQPPFGASKGTLACTVGDPRFIWEMLYSSTDYGLRTFHYKEPDGTRVKKSNHPSLVWWGGSHDWRVSNDLLGKQGGAFPPWAWNLERNGPDDQHRGQNYLWAAAALSGSYLLQEEARDLLECELTRQGVLQNDIDSPRALRILQDFSKMYGLLPTQQEKDNLITVITWRLTAWENQWTGGQVTGPVKPMLAWGPDARVLCCDLIFFVPWNESLGLLGMLEARALMRKIGRTDLQTRFENFIRPVVTTHLNYSVTRDNTNLLLPVNGVHWLPNGQPQPPSYYNINRPGVGTDPGPTVDMLLGTPGWFSWWSGILNGARLLLPSTSPEYQTMTEIRNTQLQPTSLNVAEWLAVGN